ncbi:MAG: hypothetical protein JSS61_00980 [Verrucomicrobia bacterium]|nr:hypothetical protein [Verrucomicrobiota bacterium]
MKRISGKSFTVAIEQMAKLLRTEVQEKEGRLPKSRYCQNPASFSTSLEQIAKLFRTQIRENS